jgi:hypothetical protein
MSTLKATEPFPMVVKHNATQDNGVGVLIDRDRIQNKEPNAFFIKFKKCRVYGNSTENVVTNALNADIESCGGSVSSGKRMGSGKLKKLVRGATAFGKSGRKGVITPVNPSGLNPLISSSRRSSVSSTQSRRPSISSTQSMPQKKPAWNPGTMVRRASFGGSRKTRKLQKRAKTFRKYSSRK